MPDSPFFKQAMKNLEISVDGEACLYSRVLLEEFWERFFFGNGPDHKGGERHGTVTLSRMNPDVLSVNRRLSRTVTVVVPFPLSALETTVATSS